ncbi:Von Willebrand factor type A domain containing protein [Pandoravirus macleodensis]|uniref:von Willebrand factor type A domain containing protein n=1 Tax=Pandoravirus macleodensis TaxID=2107707 RepID=A0A2U7UE81_9VIRU|nr:Von Willebrand factor type A domain containing protein [Pandoravirus macleodensis]AVK76746.1 Von Willebrand factor type A domain containing protein [Pandoravirus macleodensis]
MEKHDDEAATTHVKHATTPDTATYTRLTEDGIGLLVVEPHADSTTTATARRDLHVVFILDRSGSMAGAFRRVVLPACAGYLDAVKPQHASAIFFNDKAKTFPHITSAWLRASTKDGKWTTRIDRGVEAAVQFVVEDVRRHRDAEHPVYQFVFMTDGVNDVEHTDDLLKNSICQSGSRLNDVGCDSFVSVINVTAVADTRAGMWTHGALSTMSVSSEGAFAVAHTANDVETVIASLAAHTTAVVGSGVGRLRSISFGAHKDGGGQSPESPMCAITLAGTATETLVRVAGDRIALLTQGPPPSHVMIDGIDTPIKMNDILDLDTATLVLETVDDHATRVAMAQVSGHNGLDAMHAVALLGAVLDNVDASGALNKGALARLSGARTPYERVRLMRRTMEASRCRVASIRSTQLVARAAASDMAAYVSDMSKAKYGVAALRRAASLQQTPHDPASILVALAKACSKFDLKTRGDSADALQGGDDSEAPVSFISQQTADELWAEATSPDEHDRVRAAAGGDGGLDEHIVLSAFGMLGYGIEAHRPASCVVEPWHLCVRYVSCDIVATNDLICALATNTAVEDLSRKRITDAVVVRDPARPMPYDAYARSPLAALYLGVVCARNPSVVLASQATAVSALAMMRAAAQVAGHHGKNAATGAHATVLLRLALHVAHVVKNNDRAAHIASSLAGLADGASVCGSVLTTKSHVHRVAQALAYMVARDETAILVRSPDRLAAVARAMLAQAIVEAAAVSSKHTNARRTLADVVGGKTLEHIARDIVDNTENGGGDDGDDVDDDDDDKESDLAKSSLQEIESDNDVEHDTTSALETMLAITGHPMPLADDEPEPNGIVFGDDYDEAAAIAAGRTCLNWLSYGPVSIKSPIVDVLVGVALARVMHERVAPAATDAGYHGRSAFDVIDAFVASSVDAEQSCARLVSQGMKDPRATDAATFIRAYWDIDQQDAVDDDNKVALCAAALAAQTLQRPTASKRCNDPDTGAPQLESLDSVDACRAYLAATAARVRQTRYQQLLSAKSARLREIERQRREAEAAAERERLRVAWRDAHVGMPMVFTAAQVEAHNLAHPEDPWTMSKHPNTGRPSGLLADRCCFASCPESMKRLGNAGLWEHLAPGQCTPAFHVAAREAFAQLTGDYAAGRSRAEILADFTSTIKAALSDREINEVVPDMYNVTLVEFERTHGRSAVLP